MLMIQFICTQAEELRSLGVLTLAINTDVQTNQSETIARPDVSEERFGTLRSAARFHKKVLDLVCKRE